MLKKTVLVTIVFCSLQVLKAQTKLIAHKSHSGKSYTFHKSIKHSIFNLSSSNFGVAPTPFVKYAKLDTLKYISDSISVMITSNYRENKFTGRKSLWIPGIDTLINHPLFSKKNALDSIKQVLRETYYFKNPVDSIIFIGYNNSIKKLDTNKHKKNNLPAISGNINNKPPFNFKLIGFFIVFILALLIGFIYKKSSPNKDAFEKI